MKSEVRRRRHIRFSLLSLMLFLLLLASGIGLWYQRRPWKQVYLLQATSSIVNATWSPDGRRIAAADFDGALYVWDVFVRRFSYRLNPADFYCDMPRFSPDGREIAVGNGAVRNGDFAVRILNAETGQQLHCLDDFPTRPFDWQFSLDGKKLVTAGSDGLIKIWSVKQEQLLRTLVGHSGRGVSSAIFSPTGHVLGSTGYTDGSVRIWDVNTGALLQLFDGHVEP